MNSLLSHTRLLSSQIIEHILTEEECVLVKRYVKKTLIGGRSEVHANSDTRRSNLLTDNVAGLIGNMLLNLRIDGHYDGFIAARTKADLDPFQGDGGQDRIGCGIDAKTSLMRKGNFPLNYRMLVRPRERHTGWLYVQYLVNAVSLRDIHLGTMVYEVGWLYEKDLPAAPETSGPFEGAYMIPTAQLNPILCDGSPFPEYLTIHT